MNEEPKKIGDNRQPDGKFGAGNVANPNGRPKGTLSIVDAIKRQLAESPEGSSKTYLDLLIQRVFKKAIQEGDVGMIKDIINRVDGMPKGFTGDTNILNVIPILGNKTNVHFDESNTEDPAIKETN